MTVRTKSISQPRESEDGLRVLITRHYPRWKKREHFDEWIRQLSPSATLLSKYKHGEYDWDTFKTHFLMELKENIQSRDAIYALNERAIKKKGTAAEVITLLCYEKEGQPCHRHLVKDLIEEPSLLYGEGEEK